MQWTVDGANAVLVLRYYAKTVRLNGLLKTIPREHRRVVHTMRGHVSARNAINSVLVPIAGFV